MEDPFLVLVDNEIINVRMYENLNIDITLEENESFLNSLKTTNSSFHYLEAIMNLNKKSIIFLLKDEVDNAYQEIMKKDYYTDLEEFIPLAIGIFLKKEVIQAAPENFEKMQDWIFSLTEQRIKGVFMRKYTLGTMFTKAHQKKKNCLVKIKSLFEMDSENIKSEIEREIENKLLIEEASPLVKICYLWKTLVNSEFDVKEVFVYG